MSDHIEGVRYRWIDSLKQRLIVILLFISIVPILLISWTSYLSLNSLQNNKVRGGIQDNLVKVKMTLENSLSNLKHVSQQLALEGKVGRSLYNSLTASGILDRKFAENEVGEELSFIFSTNPNISLMVYYNADSGQYMFQNYPIRSKFAIQKLPVLAQQKDMTYYGPHRTGSGVDDHFVLSLSRKVNLYELNDIYIYIESNNQVVEQTFQDTQSGMDIDYVLVNNSGEVAYSENRERFPVGSLYGEQSKKTIEQAGYYAFEERSELGWTIVGLIRKELFEKEARTWFARIVLFSCVTLGISLLFVWIIWRTVYRPLTRIGKAVLSLDNDRPTEPKLTRLIEFDVILSQFTYMRAKIAELMSDIREKEKRKARLEVDKLLLQINPHFIHNTLDTIRWIARMNGQDEIDRLVSTLNRLVYYNLGKGETSTLRDEIDALKDYVELQGIRYNFTFNVRIDAEPSVLALHIPRFILQPIVENALYHGVGDDGVIKVEVGRHGESSIMIKVTDNGVGLAEDEIERLLSESEGERKKSGMGIGVQYVLRMLRFQYGEEAEFRIESGKGEGTAMIIILPVTAGDEQGGDRA